MSFFSSLKFKIMASFGLCILLILTIGATGLISLGKSNNRIQSIFSENLEPIADLGALRVADTDRRLQLRKLQIQTQVLRDKSGTEKSISKIALDEKTIETRWAHYYPNGISSDEEKQVADKIAKLLPEMKSLVAAVVTALKEEKYEEVVRLYDEKVSPLAAILDQEISKDLDLNVEQTTVFMSDSQTQYEQTRMIVVASILGSIILGVAALIFIFRSINRPLQMAIETADRIAEGQLSNAIPISSKDEFGQLLHALLRMDGKLSNIVLDIKRSSESIATASGEIAIGNMDLSSRTEQQASSLEEIAASIEELTSTVKQNADNARQANSMVVSASDIALQGGVVVGEVIDTMSSINESSKRIVDIIGVIDGIAFQTNILALNAAVEAARAGEQGRGFAVVASEVRSLAQRSATAAKEIKSLIDDSVDKVALGSRLVEKAGNTMSEIVSSIKLVKDIAGEISAASLEQSTGIDQVNQSVIQMDDVTQQNAALVEEAAAAAQSMQEQAGKLTQVVSMFKL